MWKIFQVKNHIGEVSLVNELGEKLKISIPKEHVTKEAKNLYIQSVIAAKQEADKVVTKKKINFSNGLKIVLLIAVSFDTIVAILSLIRGAK